MRTRFRTTTGSTTPLISRRTSDSGGLSDANLRGKLLPKATPLDVSVSHSRTKDEPPVSLKDVLGNASAVRGAPARASGQSGEVRAVPRRKPKNVPSKWVWIGIGAAMLVGLILLIIVILLPGPGASHRKAGGDSAAKPSAAAPANTAVDRPFGKQGQ